MNKMDLMQDKKTAANAELKIEQAKDPGKPLTKMRAGGKTNSDMLKMGRNMAKIANQKSPGRKGA